MLMCVTYLIITYIGIIVSFLYNLYLSYVTRNNSNEYVDVSHEDIVNVI